jgi:hypothetical protein
MQVLSSPCKSCHHADFPDQENIDSFTLYKNFTLFEIVNELVTKEEPCIFNPRTLQETLCNPNPRKEAHQTQKEMQQRSTGFISNLSPLFFKELKVKTHKK